jgi:type IV pilus assembly protein PilE
VNQKHFAHSGFSLIELLIAVAIIAIITAIAYPSYDENVRRGRRAEVRTLLSENAQFMERFFTENGSYSVTPGGVAVVLPTVASPRGALGANANYNIALINLTPNTYVLRAIRNGVMVGDPCDDFTLSNLGVRGTTNPPVAPRTVDGCWRN